MSVIVASSSVRIGWLESALRPLLFGGEHFIEYKPRTGDVMPMRCDWTGRVWRAAC